VCVCVCVESFALFLLRIYRSLLSSAFLRPFFVVFQHMVFVDGFLIPVKELGLLTNPGQWIRVLDATRSYICIVL
jgi:hypothetical protein